MPELQRKLPELKALDNPRAALELITTFQRIYEYIDFGLQQVRNKIEEQVKSGELSSDDLNGLVGVFFQPLAGSNVSDSLLQSILQNFGSQVANLVYASPNGSSGEPNFRNLVSQDIPNLNASKITAGVFPLVRLDTKIVKTDDTFTKTLGAPVTDGFITIKDNAGNSVKIMTTP